MLLKPVLPYPPPPTTDGGLSTDTINLKMGQETEQRTGTGQTGDSLDKKVLDRDEAAGIIQRNWRKHIVGLESFQCLLLILLENQQLFISDFFMT